MGSDFAGTIDKIGTDVTQWKVGDRVTGFNQGGGSLFFRRRHQLIRTSWGRYLATSGNPRPGSFAEFAILEADLVIGIPSGISFEEAATLPLCCLTAAQVIFLRVA